MQHLRREIGQHAEGQHDNRQRHHSMRQYEAVFEIRICCKHEEIKHRRKEQCIASALQSVSGKHYAHQGKYNHSIHSLKKQIRPGITPCQCDIRHRQLQRPHIKSEYGYLRHWYNGHELTAKQQRHDNRQEYHKRREHRRNEQ